MSIVQTTLGGDTTDEGREKPDTFRWCHDCEEWVLRSRFGPHRDHDYWAQKKAADTGDSGSGEEEDGEPEKVGAWYDITLSYSVDYRFRVPAHTKHQAEEIAKEWKFDAKPADSYHVHTDRREIKEIWEDDEDLPDDFDPYGSELLWEAFERAKEDEEDD